MPFREAFIEGRDGFDSAASLGVTIQGSFERFKELVNNVRERTRSGRVRTGSEQPDCTGEVKVEYCCVEEGKGNDLFRR